METEPKSQINFSNTEIAFEHKTNKALKKSQWLFRMMNNNALVSLGSLVTPLALKLKLPLVKPALRTTIFEQFVGGENLLDTQKVIDQLYSHNTLTILDYGAEAKSTQEELDGVMEELIKVVEFAASNTSVPIMTMKITGLSANDLLIKIQSGDALTEGEKIQKKNLLERVDAICKRAYDLKVGVMIDAEESWMQNAIDGIADDMMAEYNKTNVIVSNTFQLYRNDKLEFLKTSYDKAMTNGYKLGAKIVRGAYMDKERAYAADKGKPDLINETIEDTHRMYNDALAFCVDNYTNIMSVCATHNAVSNLLQARLIDERGIAKDHPHLNFCQLYGMSDNITFNLAQAGYNVAKYVPYGPIHDVIPYLIRRAKENTAVTGDMSRELSFINDEIKRRGL
jgi:proline dehydrogenase